MDLREYCVKEIVLGLRGDPREALAEGFDEARRADTRPHRRKDAYAWAYGVFRPFPGNPVFGRQDIWDMVQRMFDRICDWIGEDGAWAWHIPITGKTHRQPYSFSFYLWLRLFQEFGEHMAAGRRGRVEKTLRASLRTRMEAVRKTLVDITDRNVSLNILCHYASQLWYGGRLFGEDEWRDAAASLLDRIVAMQSPDGYWVDAKVPRGPVNMYSGVTLNGVAVYALHSGNAAARAAVRRAAEFHLAAAYPDGTLVETFDERNRHSPQTPSAWLVPSFALLAETQPAAAEFARRYETAAPCALAPDRPRIAADLCEALDLVPAGDIPTVGDRDGVKRIETAPALCARRKPWYLCVSGATTDYPGSMFHHDLQQHISVWHDRRGLVIGGGNSLQDPPFSTFRFAGTYLAKGGEVREEKGRFFLVLHYGSVRAEATLCMEDDSTLQITAQAAGPLPPDAEFALQFPGVFGAAFRHEAKPLDTTLGNKEGVYINSRTEALPDGADFALGPLRVAVDGPYIVSWPHPPISIYNVPIRLPVENAVFRVAVGLTQGPRTIRVTVR